jgi:hypothetical protein
MRFAGACITIRVCRARERFPIAPVLHHIQSLGWHRGKAADLELALRKTGAADLTVPQLGMGRS